MAAVPVDTRLDENRTGLRTPEEVVSLIGRMDAVITTRLHGMVLALKQGVPALALDPIEGGAKISRQAESIGWPACLRPEAFTREAVNEQWAFCLSEEARKMARSARDRAIEQVELVHRQFAAAIRNQARKIEKDAAPAAASGSRRHTPDRQESAPS
jgi:polysaccharide pyruvyl transferase WcaK-like protein